MKPNSRKGRGSLVPEEGSWRLSRYSYTPGFGPHLFGGKAGEEGRQEGGKKGSGERAEEVEMKTE